MQNLIPKPVETQSDGGLFSLSPASSIYVEPAATELTAIAQYLAARHRRRRPLLAMRA
jgi:hypothetical protein